MLVFNKTELLSPLDRKILQKKYPDAILLSALDRESTRPLLARLATELAERWDQSARPVITPLEDESLLEEGKDEDAGEPDEEAMHASTLEELLRAAGRRCRAARGLDDPRQR